MVTSRFALQSIPTLVYEPCCCCWTHWKFHPCCLSNIRDLLVNYHIKLRGGLTCCIYCSYICLLTCSFIFLKDFGNEKESFFFLQLTLACPQLHSECPHLSSFREKMPFHHVTAGLLYKGNYLSRSLSDSDSDVMASISVEELDGQFN